MLSNKEKRFSHAMPLTSSHEVNYPLSMDAPMSNYQFDYSLLNAPGHSSRTIDDNSQQQQQQQHDQLNALPSKASIQQHGKQWQATRFSNSLRNSLHQDLIMNRALKNNTFADKKNNNDHSSMSQQHFEAISQHRKETQEMKKQMFQMEKSLKYWSECTEYWRNKWMKTKEEKKQQQNELKQLRWKVSKLEQQLQVCERKNEKLTEESVTANNELAKYVQRFANDHRKPMHKTGSLQIPQRNRIGKESAQNNQFDDQNGGGSEDKSHLRRLNTLTFDDMKTSSNNFTRGLVLRQHERLFNKKIMNKKRFSQVVMVDEDEIMQLNEEIPIKETVSHNQTMSNGMMTNESDGSAYDTPDMFTYSQQTQQPLEHLPEEQSDVDEDEEEKTTETEGIDSSEVDNPKIVSNKMDHSNISTMATNSECANVGSIRQYGSDSDSRGVQSIDTPLKTPARQSSADLVANNLNHIDDYEDGEI